MSRYTPFLQGEVISLCVPSQAAIDDGWGDWFNDAANTRYLMQGVFPNYPGQQAEFLSSLANRTRLALMICDPEGEKLWGTISLSGIDFIARSAQIALVMSNTASKRPALAGLEAMARMTEHGFTTLGLDRIWAGQAVPGLSKWNQRLDVFGYRAEGILRRGFAKGRSISNSVIFSALFEDYERILELGSYWPGAETMTKRLRALPKVPLSERLAVAIRKEQEAYQAELDAAWANIRS